LGAAALLAARIPVGVRGSYPSGNPFLLSMRLLTI
jgi:hypothetical protein